MPFTDADLAAIRTAIARGEQSVTFADRTVTYRSIDDLLKAEAHVAASLQTRAKQTLIVASKGL